VPLNTSSDLFRGPYYNRRRSSLAKPKPLISKLYGVSTWVCRVRGSRDQGFGITPTAAYNAWKREIGLC
jgi:hypothetical protein